MYILKFLFYPFPNVCFDRISLTLGLNQSSVKWKIFVLLLKRRKETVIHTYFRVPGLHLSAGSAPVTNNSSSISASVTSTTTADSAPISQPPPDSAPPTANHNGDQANAAPPPPVNASWYIDDHWYGRLQ